MFLLTITFLIIITLLLFVIAIKMYQEYSIITKLNTILKVSNELNQIQKSFNLQLDKLLEETK